MPGPIRILRRLLGLLRTRRRDMELEEELQFHLEMETAALRNEGLDDDAAREAARHRFGSVLHVREQARDSRGVRHIEELVQDVRFGLRSFRRRPVFATAAILTLAIGIGGTTAIFGAVYGVLIAPLPYADSERIITIWQTSAASGGARGEVSLANFLDWRERQRSFDAIAAAEPFSLDHVGPDGPESFRAAVVTRGFFDLLGTRPLLGRTFTEGEFEPGRNRAVVLSERLWRTRFGADSSLVGRTLVLDTVPMLVVGVMPAAFELPHGEETWIPKAFAPGASVSRTAAYHVVVGRLADGVSVAAANADMSRIASQLASEFPGTNAQTGALVIPLADVLFGGTRKALWLLAGAVGFLLFIACANVASLQLTEAVRRQRELAIRAALGAGRGRLTRQLLTESLLLALLGGVAGVVIAKWGIAAIRALAPADLPRIEQIGLGLPVVMFALALSVLAAMIFGTPPILQATRSRLAQRIAGSGGTTGTQARRPRRVQRILAGSEIALALALIVGAGLLVRSFASLLNVDRGFSTEGVVNVTVQAWQYYPTGAHRAEYVREATAHLAALPGVEAAGMTSSLPLSVPIGMDRTGMTVEGVSDVDARAHPPVHVAAATAGYFGTLRIPLLSGRNFAEGDNAAGTPVAVVNAEFARRYWPGDDPIGKRITFAFQSRPLERTVVGVVGDVRHGGLQSDPTPSVFIPHAQGPTGAIQLVFRTSGDVMTAQRLARTELVAMNGTMPLSEITSLEARLAGTLRERTFHMRLLGAFSIMALLLAALGLYGVMSHLASERTREIGVRMAIGARAGDVVWMVFRQGMSIAAAGVVAGLATAFVLTRLMSSMLFNVQPLDPASYIAAITVIIVVASAASWLPARRASRVDPMRVLRSE